MILDKVPCVLVRLQSVKEIRKELELSIISAFEVRLDRDTVLKVQSVGENRVVDHYHVLYVAVGNYSKFLHADAFVRNAALSKQGVLDLSVLRIQNVDDSFRVILASAGEDNELELSGHPAQELSSKRSDVDSDFLRCQLQV